MSSGRYCNMHVTASERFASIHTLPICVTIVSILLASQVAKKGQTYMLNVFDYEREQATATSKSKHRTSMLDYEWALASTWKLLQAQVNIHFI